jgi:hypothetical protein
VWDARVERRGAGSEPTGVDWLDESGEDPAVVRLSRAVGLPDGWPDVHGLAVRIEAPAGSADLLFATTGWSPGLRFVLTPSRHPRARPMTTLLPYRTSTGPLLLGARGVAPDRYELSWARPTGPWHAFGAVLLTAQRPDDTALSFDPVRRELPGLDQYPAIVRLREPAYLRARRSRDEA